MEIDHFLPDAPLPMVHSQSLFAFPIRQAVQAKKIAIAGLDDVLLCFVAKKGADICKVGCASDGRCKCLLSGACESTLRGRKEIEEALRLIIAEVDYRIGCKRSRLDSTSLFKLWRFDLIVDRNLRRQTVIR